MSHTCKQNLDLLSKEMDVIDAQTIIGEDYSQELLTPCALPPLYTLANQTCPRQSCRLASLGIVAFFLDAVRMGKVQKLMRAAWNNHNIDQGCWTMEPLGRGVSTVQSKQPRLNVLTLHHFGQLELVNYLSLGYHLR